MPLDPSLQPVVNAAAKAYNLPPALLTGMLQTESNFDPAAMNPRTGALGIAQFMPDTAKDIGIDPIDPRQAIVGMAYYLRQNIEKFNNIDQAIAAYDYGPAATAAALQKASGSGQVWTSALPQETQDYLHKVAGYTADAIKASRADTQPPASSPGLLDSAASAASDTGNWIKNELGLNGDSVLDRVQLPDQSTVGTDLSNDVGPMRADAYQKMRADISKQPLSTQQQMAQQPGISGTIAGQVAADTARRSAGDMLPQSTNDIVQDVDDGTLPQTPQESQTGFGSIAGEVLKGVAQAGDQLGMTAGLAASSVGRLADSLYQVATNSPDTPIQDAVFKNIVKPFADEYDANAPDQKSGFMGKLAHTVGGLGVMMGEGLITGGATFEAQLADSISGILANAGRQAMAGMAIPAATSMIDTGRSVLQKTGDVGQAGKAMAATFLSTVALGATPLSAEGGLGARMLTGAVAMPVVNEALQPLTQAALPASMQTSRTWEDRALDAVVGAGFGAIGHGPAQDAGTEFAKNSYNYSPEHRAAAISVGQEALQAANDGLANPNATPEQIAHFAAQKAFLEQHLPSAENPEGNPEQLLYAIGVPPPAQAPKAQVSDILAAPDIDTAIKAASDVVSQAQTEPDAPVSDAADQLLRVRTLQPAPPEAQQTPEPAAKPANAIIPTSAFGPDRAAQLDTLFLEPDRAGEPVPLANAGFTAPEITALQRAGLATDGAMSWDQYGDWAQEQERRGSQGPEPAKQPAPVTPTPEAAQALSKEASAPAGAPAPDAGDRLGPASTASESAETPVAPAPYRAHTFGTDAPVLSQFRSVEPLKADPDYQGAKGGDVEAATRLVQNLVQPENVVQAREKFGAGAIYVPVHAEEAAGTNKIPLALAAHYAAGADGELGAGILQTNKTYHTGANAMDRVAYRSEFSGGIEAGRRYVLVDDVTTMGSTLADMASYIRSQGGDVAGAVTLANASRSGIMAPAPSVIKILEARHGNEIRNTLGIEPSALTRDEAQYLVGFRSPDELRARVARAGSERSDRIASKVVPADEGPPRAVAPPEAPPEPTPTPANAGVSVSGEPDSLQPGITRQKSGKIGLVGVPEADVRVAAKTLGLVVRTGDNGSFLVSAKGGLPVSPRLEKGLRESLLGKNIAQPKARTYDTSTLFGAIRSLGGINSDYALDITGETNAKNMRGYPVGLFSKSGHSPDEIARALSQEYGFGINLDDARDNGGINQLTDLLHQAASGSPVYSMERAERERGSGQAKNHEAQIKKLANEYGVELRNGIRTRPFQDVEKEVADAIGFETGVAGRTASELHNRALADGIPEADLNQIEDKIADEFHGDLSPDAMVQMWRKIASTIEDRINEREELAAQDAGAGGDQATQSDEVRPPLDLAGQTPAEARAEQDRLKAPEGITKEQIDREATLPFRLSSETQDNTPSAANQGGIFTPDGRSAKAAESRGEVGASLTKEQRKAVLGTLVDVYKAKGAPKESKGLDHNGNERSGYVHSPDLFEKSDITGKMVRYHVTLPDGRIAHPTELFPDYTQSDIDAAVAAQKHQERQAELDRQDREKVLESRKADDINTANRLFWKHQHGGNIQPEETVLLTDGKQFVRALKDRADADLAVLGKGWAVKPIEIPAHLIDNGNPPNQPAPDEVSRAKAALDAAGVTGADRTSTIAAVRRGDLTADEVSESHGQPKIADFGEKIEGAKKDLWQNYKKAMSDELPADAKDITLSKNFPEPDYENLIASGVDIRTIAAVKAMRDEIPSKPQKSYRVARWAESVKMLRGFANDLLAGRHDIQYVLDKMRKTGGLGGLADKIEMYAELGYPAFKSAKGYDISSGWTALNEDGTRKPGQVFTLTTPQHRHEMFPSYQDAIGSLHTQLERLPEGDGRSTKLDIYRVTKTGDIVIGKKVASNKFIDLKTGFTNVRDARAYLKDNEADLLAQLAKKKEVAPTRRSVNNPRTGQDYRQGEDVTPEKFASEFGFRGVQFGNYVEQGRRPRDLNNAYDALLDLAHTIGVPPRALSLNGSLGLAFGARGGGGVDPAAAHYEPDHVVINLTKVNGFGSLAHEVFHAIDNYFSKARGNANGFLTGNPRVQMVPGDGNRLTEDISVRPEVVKAFGELMAGIKDSDFYRRSAELDKRRSKDYWSTDEELAARAFESYIISKAEAKGESNDYLANIISEEAHDASNGIGRDLGMDDEPYPYPTKKEQATINPLFDKLFATIKTKETDQGTAMFSRLSQAGDETVGRQIHIEDLGAVAQRFRSAFPGIPVHVLENESHAPSSLSDEVAKHGAEGDWGGAYHNGEVYLLRPGLRDIRHAEQTALHEATHAGLDRMFGRQLDPAMLGINRSNGRVRLMADRLVQKYGYSVARATGEVLADMGPEVSKLNGWDRLVAAARGALRRAGFVKEWTDNDISALVHRALSSAKKNEAFHLSAGTALQRQDEFPTADEDGNAVEMNAGINPVPAVKGIRDNYSPYVGVDNPPRTKQAVSDAFARAFAPASRGEEALATAGIVRANLGEQARIRERAMQETLQYAKAFDKMPVEESYRFIDAMERGAPLKDQMQNAAAKAIRKMLDERRDQVIALGNGKLEHFISDYFPHIWQDRQAASSFYSRRPLEGSKGFLKSRTFDFFVDGLKAGLKPISNNPIELALLKAREMDRYIYGQRMFQEMKARGLAKFVPYNEKRPDGWEQINDRIAQGFERRLVKAPDNGTADMLPEAGGQAKYEMVPGKYYAPEPAATVINNHLSPGFRGNGIYDFIHRSSMMMNTAQLGLSAFHLGFTTLDAMISKGALGVKQISRGDLLRGTSSIANSVNPLQPLLNLYKGDKLFKAYMGDITDPSMAPIVEALQQGGGRVKMDDFYRNASVNGFKQALRTGDYKSALIKSLPTLMDRISAPIFQYLVPRQKLGVFFDMAKDALDRDPNMSVEEQRVVMGKLWDSVDNRMGEMVYDNLFWNRALKDALMVSVRSVGWNLGTLRELGGGIKDLGSVIGDGKRMKQLADGSFVPAKEWKGLSDRSGYVFSLAFVTAIVGSIINYLYTGKAPQELKDVYFPRTGKTRPDGSVDRLSLPSYIKDIYEYGHDIRGWYKYGEDPMNTVANKLNPLLGMMNEIRNNEDFFGAAIRSPGDTKWQQALDEADFLAKQFTPFGLRNYIQQSKVKGDEPTVHGYVTSPSFYGITPAPGYVVKTDEETESGEVSRMRASMIKKFRNEIKDRGVQDDTVQRMRNAGLSTGDIRFVMRTSGNTQKPHRLKAFGTSP